MKKIHSAKTRSWSVAEQRAAAIRDSWDPVKQKLKALEEAAETRELEATTIDFALQRWLSNVGSKDNSPATMSKYATAEKQIGDWARLHRLTRVEQITPDNLDAWQCLWSPDADRPENRIGKTTAARRLELIKRFTKYCMKMGWIEKDPVSGIDAISPDESETLPLLEGRYEAVLAATYRYDEQMRPDDRFGQELRALIELMCWTGMRRRRRPRNEPTKLLR